MAPRVDLEDGSIEYMIKKKKKKKIQRHIMMTHRNVLALTMMVKTISG